MFTTHAFQANDLQLELDLVRTEKDTPTVANHLQALVA
jgi:hypothetical protein